MLPNPNVTQSFKLQRRDLESCRAEAVLRLFIALSIFLLHINMQLLERDRQELCFIQNTR